MGKEKELKTEKESSHTSFTDDLLVNMFIELTIGGIIFYLSYVFYVSTLTIPTFLMLCLLVFFASIATIFSSLIAYPITRYISKKAQHERKGFRDLHPKMNLQYTLTFIFNLILTAILIMLGFYIYISLFLENQTWDIAILIYLVIKMIVVLLATLMAFVIIRMVKKGKKSKFYGYILVIAFLTIYLIMIIFAIMFIFLE